MGTGTIKLAWGEKFKALVQSGRINQNTVIKMQEAFNAKVEKLYEEQYKGIPFQQMKTDRSEGANKRFFARVNMASYITSLRRNLELFKRVKSKTSVLVKQVQGLLADIPKDDYSYEASTFSWDISSAEKIVAKYFAVSEKTLKANANVWKMLTRRSFWDDVKEFWGVTTGPDSVSTDLMNLERDIDGLLEDLNSKLGEEVYKHLPSRQ